MPKIKHPGVYVVEKDAFPNAVAEVETAIPAFIGYTEFSSCNDKAIAFKPFRIRSLSEYETFFR